MCLTVKSLVTLLINIDLVRIRKKKNGEAQFAHGDCDSDEVLLMATTKEEDDKYDMWYLDTGYSNHMSGNKERFLYLYETMKKSVQFAKDRVVKAGGIDSVKIRSNDGKVSTISDVMYGPTMKSNLITLCQLLEKGYTI